MTSTVRPEFRVGGLAYHWQPPTGGQRRVIVFFPGFRSDKEGTKAMALAERCQGRGYGYLGFDYRGHGSSSGQLTESTVSDWLDDCITILTNSSLKEDHGKNYELTLIGSSMGGYLVLLTVQHLFDSITHNRGKTYIPQVTKVLLLAPAVDFVNRLLVPRMAESDRSRFEASQELCLRDDQGDALIFPGGFYQDALRHQLLDPNHEAIKAPSRPPIGWAGELRIIHGLQDDVVPLVFGQVCLDLTESTDAELIVIKQADHRLSRPQDLERLWSICL